MDKISIVRLAAAYLRTAGCLSDNWNEWKAHDVGWDGSEVGMAVEGIPILVAADGSIAFVSDAIDTLLGLNPLDLMGNLLYDYVHLCDHQELDSLLTVTATTSAAAGSEFKNKFIRLKTTLTSRGKRVNLSQAAYRVWNYPCT
jgi:PAS domain-containing protein